MANSSACISGQKVGGGCFGRGAGGRGSGGRICIFMATLAPTFLNERGETHPAAFGQSQLSKKQAKER